MAVAQIVNSAKFASGDSQQNAVPLALSALPLAGDVLVAFITGSAATGAIAPPDASWRALDAPIVTANGLIAASFSKVATSAEPASYAFSVGSGAAADYVSGVLVQFRSTIATAIDLHLTASGTVTPPAEATTPTMPSPVAGDVVIAAIATQGGGDAGGYGVGTPAAWTIDQIAEPRANATILAHATNTATDTSTPFSFAVSPGAEGGDYVGFLLFVRASATSGGSGSVGVFVPGDIVRTDAGVVVKSTAAQIMSTSPTGGVPPYKFQWHRSPTPVFTPSSATALAGQTMSSINDTSVSPGGRYYYVLAMSDSSAGAVPTYTLPQVVVVPAGTVTIGFIGDGIGYGVGTTIASAAQAMQDDISAAYATATAPKTVGLINASVPGTSSIAWMPGGQFLQNAVAQFAAAGVAFVVVALGTEDARDDIATAPGDYFSALRAICAYIFAEIPGVVVIPMFPPPIDVSRAQAPFSVNSLGRLASYLTLFATLGAAQLGGTLSLGDTNAWTYFARVLFDQIGADGVHPNDLGAATLGALYARAFTLASATGTSTVKAPTGVTVALSYPAT